MVPRLLFGVLVAAVALPSCAPVPPPPAQASTAALQAAVAAPTRTPANVARDRYRHPVETLAFFGVRPSDTVAVTATAAMVTTMPAAMAAITTSPAPSRPRASA